MLSKILHLIELGLCNSVMGWKEQSTNHRQAVKLIEISVALYLFVLTLESSKVIEIDLYDSDTALFVTVGICILTSFIISWVSFRDKERYEETKVYFQSLTPLKSGLIRVLSVVFVFAFIPLLVNTVD